MGSIPMKQQVQGSRLYLHFTERIIIDVDILHDAAWFVCLFVCLFVLTPAPIHSTDRLLGTIPAPSDWWVLTWTLPHPETTAGRGPVYPGRVYPNTSS